MKAYTLTFVLVGALLSSGCASMRKVSYPIKDVVQRNNPSFSQSQLVVKEFRDVREVQPKYSKLMAYLGSPVPEMKKSNDFWYYNHNLNYRKNFVAPWIAEMMIKHIRSSNLFGNVTLFQEGLPGGEYLLEGKIKEFEGLIQKDIAAESINSVGMQFGAIGGIISGLANSARTSKFEAETILMDVSLTEIDTGIVLWEGVVEGRLEGEAPSSVDGWRAYTQANLSLKAAVESLLDKLENLSVFEDSLGSMQ